MVEPKELWTSKADELKKAGKFEEAIKFLDKVQELEKEEMKNEKMHISIIKNIVNIKEWLEKSSMVQ